MSETPYNRFQQLSVWLANKLDEDSTQTRIRGSLFQIARTCTGFCLAIIVLTLLYTSLPALETNLYPPIRSLRATNFFHVEKALYIGEIEVKPGDWLFDVHGLKDSRPNCEYLRDPNITALVYDRSNELAYSGYIINTNPHKGTRPIFPREQYLGRWVLHSDERSVSPGSEVWVRFKYNCNLPWITIANAGPFIIGQSTRAPITTPTVK